MSLLYAVEPDPKVECCDNCDQELVTEPSYPTPFCPDGCDGPHYGPDGTIHCDYSDPDHEYDVWNEQ